MSAYHLEASSFLSQVLCNSMSWKHGVPQRQVDMFFLGIWFSAMRVESFCLEAWNCQAPNRCLFLNNSHVNVNTWMLGVAKRQGVALSLRILMYNYYLETWNCKAPNRYLFFSNSDFKLPLGGLEFLRARSLAIRV